MGLIVWPQPFHWTEQISFERQEQTQNTGPPPELKKKYTYYYYKWSQKVSAMLHTLLLLLWWNSIKLQQCYEQNATIHFSVMGKMIETYPIATAAVFGSYIIIISVSLKVFFFLVGRACVQLEAAEWICIFIWAILRQSHLHDSINTTQILYELLIIEDYLTYLFIENFYCTFISYSGHYVEEIMLISSTETKCCDSFSKTDRHYNHTFFLGWTRT